MWRRGWRNYLLRGKGLSAAHWADAHFGNADLSNTELYMANLQNTDARYVNFAGANLYKVKLDGMRIWQTKCSENTTLPNGEKCEHDSDLLFYGAVFAPPDIWYLSDYESIKIDTDSIYQEKLGLFEGLHKHLVSGKVDRAWIIEKLQLTDYEFEDLQRGATVERDIK